MDLPIKRILQLLRQCCCPILPARASKESRSLLLQQTKSHSTVPNDSQQHQSNIRYGPLDLKHLDDVIILLLEAFFAKEPAGLSIGLDSESQVKPWLRTLIEYQLKLQLSLGAWDTITNQLVGVSVNETDTINESAAITLDGLVTPEFETMYKITELMREMHCDRDLFQTYHVQTFGHVSMLGVREEYGGRGIATKLVELSEKAFLEHQVTDIYVEATNEFSAGAFRRLGYTLIAELLYEDYKRNGEVVFKNMGIHKTCRLYIKSLSATKRE